MTTIFGKIIRKELPADIVYENENIIAFKDIHPAASVHLLIVPKKEIPNLQSVSNADLPIIQEIIQVAQELAIQFDIADGYRLVTNNGANAGQMIDHLHFHLIGGQKLGPLA